jgi:uncharacterized membrane protein YecN with MAPEG domain
MPHVTLLYGGLTALLLTLLGMNVTRLRRKHHAPATTVQLHPELHLAIRAHGNAAEWAPLGVVLLGLLEASGLGSTPLHVLGGALFGGRALHAAGFIWRPKGLAAGAATINYLVMLVLSVWAIARHFA